ncbi:MAG: hypothetical protein REI96_12200 [Flavobacterium nitrogenifigens]|uniref:hypothetical protein n=1 Tax=Flavobacterium nitrogenifigens TaxID=1617283 RepID=UPI002807764D|nr:hypothetical protein [Flavobacterium nitrogenifigens]MDQ8013205.1 hypothetical protein [Flavobacterium nitrogenifigens]
MKKIALLLFSIIVFSHARAQTPQELIGRWKLVRWTKHKKEKTVDDSTFQVFSPNGQFLSIAQGKTHKGKWKLWKNSSILTITSAGVLVLDFKIDYFDSRKRIMTADGIGTLEYVKAD